MTIHQIRCIEPPFSSTNSELLPASEALGVVESVPFVLVAVVVAGTADSDVVVEESEVEIGIDGNSGVDEVAEDAAEDVELETGGREEELEARDCEGEIVGKKFCRLTILVIDGVVVAVGAESAGLPVSMSLSGVDGLMVLVVSGMV